MSRTELTANEQRHKDRIDELVEARAQAVREQVRLTDEIADACIDARKDGTRMSDLAQWVKVFDLKKNELRSVSRQSVDQLVATHEGRERRPRPRRQPEPSSNGNGGVRLEIFQ